MVRMVIVGAVPQNKISFPAANETDEFTTNFQSRQQLPVVVVQNYPLDAEKLMSFLHFFQAAAG